MSTATVIFTEKDLQSSGIDFPLESSDDLEKQCVCLVKTDSLEVWRITDLYQNEAAPIWGSNWPDGVLKIFDLFITQFRLHSLYKQICSSKFPLCTWSGGSFEVIGSAEINSFDGRRVITFTKMHISIYGPSSKENKKGRCTWTFVKEMKLHNPEEKDEGWYYHTTVMTTKV